MGVRLFGSAQHVLRPGCRAVGFHLTDAEKPDARRKTTNREQQRRSDKARVSEYSAAPARCRSNPGGWQPEWNKPL